MCPNTDRSKDTGDFCFPFLKSSTVLSLTLQEVVNIVGMVGAGKSTLIKVLAFWCHQNGYRIAIVVDTVAEV